MGRLALRRGGVAGLLALAAAELKLVNDDAQLMAVARISTSRVRLPSMMTRLIAILNPIYSDMTTCLFDTTNIANYNASIIGM